MSDSATEVQRDPQRSLPFSWPRTHRSKFQDQALWRSALCKVFTRSASPQVLVQPLSSFLSSASATWLWNCLPSEQRLFIPAVLSWDFHHVSAGCQQSLNRTCHHGGSVSSLPHDARAATVSLQGQQARLLSVGLVPAPNPIAGHLLPFSQTLDALPASSWAIKELALPPNLQPVLASLRAGSVNKLDFCQSASSQRPTQLLDTCCLFLRHLMPFRLLLLGPSRN